LVDGGFVDQVGVPFSSDHTHISCFDSATAPAPGAASNADYEIADEGTEGMGGFGCDHTTHEVLLHTLR
jgi:hypothetical protein